MLDLPIGLLRCIIVGDDSSFTSHAKFVHEAPSQTRRTTAVVESSSENSIMKRHAWVSPCTYSRMLDTILQLELSETRYKKFCSYSTILPVHRKQLCKCLFLYSIKG